MTIQGLGTDARKYSGKMVGTGRDANLQLTYDGQAADAYPIERTRYDVVQKTWEHDPKEEVAAGVPARQGVASERGGRFAVHRSTALNRVDGRNNAQWEVNVRETVRSLEMMRGLDTIFGRTF